MTSKIRESERMKLICEYLKTGQTPNGFKITETKNGRYRLSRVKPDKEALQEKRMRLQKCLEDIDKELEAFTQQEPEPKKEEA